MCDFWTDDVECECRQRAVMEATAALSNSDCNSITEQHQQLPQQQQQQQQQESKLASSRKFPQLTSYNNRRAHWQQDQRQQD
jgi:hypothetical protein